MFGWGTPETPEEDESSFPQKAVSEITECWADFDQGSGTKLQEDIDKGIQNTTKKTIELINFLNTSPWNKRILNKVILSSVQALFNLCSQSASGYWPRFFSWPRPVSPSSWLGSCKRLQTRASRACVSAQGGCKGSGVLCRNPPLRVLGGRARLLPSRVFRRFAARQEPRPPEKTPAQPSFLQTGRKSFSGRLR